MRIQHNIAALNSHRQLTNNNSAVAKNLEKLSSGYKINRAGDDAAGLAISEKMRAQITGLDTASKNAQDGISLVQTAEGALTEVHSMLNRMAELADQSANGTYQDSVDRENIQKEMDSLRSEVDRISKGTNFNGIKLLDGSLSSAGADSTGTATAASVKFSGPKGVKPADVNAIAGTYAMSTGVGAATMAAGDKISYTFEYTDNKGVAQTKTINLTHAATAASTTAFCLVDDEGNEYAMATSTGHNVVAKDINDALVKILSDDAELSANFKMTANTGNTNVTFTALDKGVGGASLTGVKQSSTVKATGITTTVANAAAVGTKAMDAYETIDLTSMAAYDGKNADKAIFELNGEKFAFISSTLAGDDLKKALESLKEAGVTHYVQNAAAGAPAAADVTDMVEKINYQLSGSGVDVKQGVNANGVFTPGTGGTSISLTVKADKKPVAKPEGGGLVLQIGESSDDFNKLSVSVKSMSTTSLGIDTINIGTQKGASDAINLIKEAINTVSSTRGDLGAIQNRLEHTINNLGVTSENMSAAESRIRDVDMAKEMMTFTKNNILTQASQAMLAQANQLPQGVLQLLQ